MTEEDVLNAWRKTAIPKDDFEKEAYEIVEKALETVQELKNQNITMTHLLENYMKFEDECVEKGFTFSSLLEAREKQIPKIPTYEGDGCDPEGNIILDEWLCPNCNERYEVDYDFCPNCGQAIDWSENNEENE